jgi:predicted ATPase/DNA-binding SARP family transcriptional activator
VSGDSLHIQLLGAFRVALDGRVIESEAWRLRKAANLLKLLALAPAHRLQKEQIMELLWPELTPQAAANNLRRTLHEARRCLEPGTTGSQYIISQADHLFLTAPVALSTDVEQFEQAALHARNSPTPETYQAAVDKYTGELLPQDRYEDWAAGRREELRQTFLSLLMEQARLRQGRGEWQAAIAACQRVVALEPSNEEAHGLLMRLYALGGQRGQALQQYQQLASALRADLGVEPDPALQRLRDEIAAGRLPSDGQLVLAAPAATPRLPTNLPHALTSFVGRADAITAVKQRLEQIRLLTLTGPGGSGKTRLALQVARDLVERYMHGVWLVELAPLSDPSLVPQTVAQALGLKEARDRDVVQLLAASLKARHLLLILDNCEHLIETVAQLADTLLRAAPRLTILTTSRQPLEVLGEGVWPVPPLSLPPTDWPPERLPEFEAIQLFTERARLVEWAFSLSADSWSTVVEICRRLDGMPLAIELAAARLRSQSLNQIAARLHERFALLTSGNRTALPRHQTLHAAIEWSYQLLPEGERRLFNCLAVFVGGASLEAVEAVWPPAAARRAGVSEGLTSLLDKSLLLREAGPGDELRVGMLETIHAFALEQLRASGELDAARERHAAYFLGLAEAAEPQLIGPRQTIWLERLEAEHGNLRAALAWAPARSDVETGLRLAAGLWRFWLVRGHYREGLQWIRRVLSQAKNLPRSALTVNVIRGAGVLSHRLGDHTAARAYYAEGLAIARERGEQSTVAELLNSSGLVAEAQGNYGEARSLYETSLGMSREASDARGVASTLNNLGWLATLQADYAAARSLIEESLALSRELGDTNMAGNALNNLGVLAYNMGDYAAARSCYDQRLALARELGSRYGTASALHNLGLVEAHQGNYPAAENLCAESLAISRELGDKTLVAASLQGLGSVHALQGESDLARAHFKQSLALALEVDDQYRIAYILEGLATVAAEVEPTQTAKLGGAAEALRDEINIPRPVSERNHYERALRSARAALDAAAWAAAWSQGRSMTLEAVIAELGVSG